MDRLTRQGDGEPPFQQPIEKVLSKRPGNADKLMRILAIDPGEKRLGIAISRPTGTIANPLTVIHHISHLWTPLQLHNWQMNIKRVKLLSARRWMNMENLSPEDAKQLAWQKRSGSKQTYRLHYGMKATARKLLIRADCHGLSRLKRSGHLDDLAQLLFCNRIWMHVHEH